MSIPPRSRRYPGTPITEALRDVGDYVPTNIVNQGSVSPFYGARVQRTTSQTVGTGANVSFDTSHFDTMGFWTSASPTKLTVQLSGYYTVWANVTCGGTGLANVRASIIRHITATNVDSEVARETANTSDFVFFTTAIQAVRDDYFVLYVETNVAAGTVTSAGAYSTSLAIAFMGT